MDMKQIKSLISTFDESGLSKIKINKEGFEIEMEKATGAAAAPTHAVVAAPAPAAVSALLSPTAAPQSISGDTIDSPMVGTYYAAPSPESDPFVQVGDMIKKGQVIAVLEAMKIMNELEAEFDCKIIEILVKDGQAVEYDMPLFVVEKI
ncbi:MAG: acetyl-CoA carboxylase biotin carboxyl carrier protein [Thiovulaceae bacterium]|nr:acetyl-CoA carboxylase biotin carboxyl carrier protein [Sulfurimonadaceae bacterium]